MPAIDLESAAREVVRLLDGVTEDRMDDPTPCAGTSVAGLLDHVMGLTLAFTWAARKSVPDGDGPRPGIGTARLDPHWRALLPRRLDDLVAAWRDPAAWEGTTEAGGVRLPAEQMAVVALDELVLHGWDLARATGQSFACSPADTEAVLAFTTAAARPEQAAGREGLFGPVVEVPESAPAFDRALGLAGRDPAWTPESA
ncbi:TIGR03086 family metal-binding protein [Nonomuraea antimicrobica]|uniref:TIGR03086 family metal-binding protein n=1 Tax=Nonomuraea antimicrobica TaxID=561173 RepID=A0ABP7D9Q7_9ACTN